MDGRVVELAQKGGDDSLITLVIGYTHTGTLKRRGRNSPNFGVTPSAQYLHSHNHPVQIWAWSTTPR
jgi:hypothetical protein